MKKHILLSLAVLLAGGRLAAQQRDSMRAPSDTAEAGRLRAQIEQRFNDRATQERFGARRRDVMQQQLGRRQALETQMQPGIAANSDSVRKLMDGMQVGRGEMVKIEQDQDREMSGYLTPVQRARYQQMRERLMQRVGEMRMERRDGRGMGRGGRMGAPPRLRGGRRGRGI